MSEPSADQLREIIEIFLSRYNKIYNTNYQWIDHKSYNAKSSNKNWLDASVFDKNNRELEIQYKEVIWDVLYDKIRSGVAKKLVKKLIETLAGHGLNEFTIHLNFYQKYIPATDEEISNFCFWVAELIRSKSNDGYPNSYHLFLLPKTILGYYLRFVSSLKVFIHNVFNAYYIATDQIKNVRQHIYSYEITDEIYLEHIKKVTSSITIFKNPKQKEPVVGWGYSELIPRPLPHFSDVVISEIKRTIENLYDGIIVLLDCNRPIDEYDFKEIFKQIKQISFTGQIWLVENFSSKRAATRIF